jgi:pimeloyl-ACP methyl ester carboxylesterase
MVGYKSRRGDPRTVTPDDPPQAIRSCDGRSLAYFEVGDRLIPDPINKTVADRTSGVVWHPVAGAGHFVAVGQADEIFRITAEELGAS